jgi:hypothetical protein
LPARDRAAPKLTVFDAPGFTMRFPIPTLALRVLPVPVIVRVLFVTVPPKVPLRVTFPLDTRVLTPVLVKVPVELKLVQEIEPELESVPLEVTPATAKLPPEAMVSVPVPFIDVAPVTVSVLLPIAPVAFEFIVSVPAMLILEESEKVPAADGVNSKL